MQGTIVGMQVYDLTKDELALGMIGGAEAIPAIILSLFGGWLADHFNRRKILIVALIALSVQSFALFSFSLNIDFVVNQWGVYPIYVIIFCTGIARAFLGPAQFALLPQTVGSADLYKTAISWNSVLWQSSMVAGPPIGALIYAHVGVQESYMVSLILIILSVFMFVFMAHKPLPNIEKKDSIITSLKEGLNFVFKKEEIIAAMSLDMLAVLFGGAVALMPAFCDKVYHVNAEGVGLLRSATALGSVPMMMLIAYIPLKKNVGFKMLFCVFCYALCMTAFAFNTNYILGVVILAISGAFDAVSVVIRQTLLQTLTPENMKGRVSAVSSIFVGSSNELGEVESGVAAKIYGLQKSVFVGSLISQAVVIFMFFRAKKLRKLDF